MSQFHCFFRWFPGVLAALLLPFATSGSQPERIVSIGGAATEIVWALGAGDRVVAVDLSSTWPEEVRNLPQVGYVRSVSPEGVLSMRPDLIVATGALGPPAARKMMERFAVETVWLPDPDSVEDLRLSIEKVAAGLDRAGKGEALWASIENQLQQVEANRPQEGERPEVLFLLEPPSGGSAGMAGGEDSRAEALIRLAGGRNAASGFFGFRPVSFEGILEMNPQIILVALSSGHGGTEAEIEGLRNHSSLQAVAAVRNNAVYGVPLDDLAFGPRLGDVVKRWSELFSGASSPQGGSSPARSE